MYKNSQHTAIQVGFTGPTRRSDVTARRAAAASTCMGELLALMLVKPTTSEKKTEALL